MNTIGGDDLDDNYTKKVNLNNGLDAVSVVSNEYGVCDVILHHGQTQKSMAGNINGCQEGVAGYQIDSLMMDSDTPIVGLHGYSDAGDLNSLGFILYDRFSPNCANNVYSPNELADLYGSESEQAIQIEGQITKDER